MTERDQVHFITILGSYDPQTKTKLLAIKEEIAKKFIVKNVFPLLLDSAEVYFSDGRDFLTEIYEDKVTIYVFQDREMLDIVDCTINGSVSSTVLNYVKIKYGIDNIQKRPILKKFEILMTLSLMIIIIRDKEETRGGEYLELVFAMNQTDVKKIWLFYNKTIVLSGMLMEFLDYFKVLTREYDENEYLQTVMRAVEYSIKS